MVIDLLPNLNLIDIDKNLNYVYTTSDELNGLSDLNDPNKINELMS